MLPPPFTADFLSKLEALRIRTKKEFLGSGPGGHLSPRRGTSLEFADYRRYVPGDDPRYIDWNLYGRTDRVYVKLFRKEEELFSYIFVDTSASMAYPVGDGKFAAARDLALALAYVVLSGHDSVRLHLLTEGREITATPLYRGRHRILDMYRVFHEQEPRGQTDLKTSLISRLHSLRRPGKAILISDFLFPPASYQGGLNLLRAANLDVVAIQVLGHQELDPPLHPEGVRLVDSEGGGELPLRFDGEARRQYQENLDRHRRELKSFCHQAGIHYALFLTSRNLQGFVLKELPSLGLLS